MKQGMSMLKSLKKRGGFTLIETLMASGILLVSALGTAVFFRNFYQLEKQYQAEATARLIIENITNTLNNNSSWQNTVEFFGNNSLSCLASLNKGLIACPADGGAFVLINSAGEQMIDPVNQGYNEKMEVCAPKGTEECPYSVDISWAPVCPNSATCFDPQVKFTGGVKRVGSAARNIVELNAKRFSFEFVQSAEQNSLSAACASVGGLFDVITRQCTLQGITRECPAPQVVRRIDENMNLVCGLAFEGACGGGLVLAGINYDGSARCISKNQCPPPPPAPPVGPTAGTPGEPPGGGPGTPPTDPTDPTNPGGGDPGGNEPGGFVDGGDPGGGDPGNPGGVAEPVDPGPPYVLIPWVPPPIVDSGPGPVYWGGDGDGDGGDGGDGGGDGCDGGSDGCH